MAAEGTKHLEGHSKKCTQVLSSGEGHSQLTSWDPRPCTKTRQETQTSFLSDRHIMLNQVLEIRSHSQKSQRIMIVWHLHQKCEVKHSKIHPSGVPCLQSKSRAVVPVDTEHVSSQQDQRRDLPEPGKDVCSETGHLSCAQEQAAPAASFQSTQTYSSSDANVSVTCDGARSPDSGCAVPPCLVLGAC